MTTEEQIKYWLKSAEYDLPVAESLYENEKYDWCLFIGHLVLEKILKAHVVHSTHNTPPKTHDLQRLALMTNIPFDDETLRFVEFATTFNLEARYPEEKFTFHSMCTKDFTS